jgi:hypothetical protein
LFSGGGACGQRNIADQKAVDLQLWDQGRRQSLWLTLAEVADRGTLDAERHLKVDGKVVRPSSRLLRI